jgi:hypothetical protein
MGGPVAVVPGGSWHRPPSARFMTRVFFGCLRVKHASAVDVTVGFDDDKVGGGWNGAGRGGGAGRPPAAPILQSRQSGVGLACIAAFTSSTNPAARACPHPAPRLTWCLASTPRRSCLEASPSPSECGGRGRRGGAPRAAERGACMQASGPEGGPGHSLPCAHTSMSLSPALVPAAASPGTSAGEPPGGAATRPPALCLLPPGCLPPPAPPLSLTHPYPCPPSHLIPLSTHPCSYPPNDGAAFTKSGANVSVSVGGPGKELEVLGEPYQCLVSGRG